MILWRLDTRCVVTFFNSTTKNQSMAPWFVQIPLQTHLSIMASSWWFEVTLCALITFPFASIMSGRLCGTRAMPIPIERIPVIVNPNRNTSSMPSMERGGRHMKHQTPNESLVYPTANKPKNSSLRRWCQLRWDHIFILFVSRLKSNTESLTNRADSREQLSSRIREK